MSLAASRSSVDVRCVARELEGEFYQHPDVIQTKLQKYAQIEAVGALSTVPSALRTRSEPRCPSRPSTSENLTAERPEKLRAAEKPREVSNVRLHNPLK